jgi:quercetin dioxygenase-like cupin family protein
MRGEAMTRELKDTPEFVREAMPDASESDVVSATEGVVSLSTALPAATGSLAAGRARLLTALVEPAERYAPLYRKLVELFDLPVAELRRIFERAVAPAEWQPGPLPWVSLLHFAGGPRVATADTGLVRLKAGSVFPRHRHQGTESVLVVDGCYEDETGRVYRAGDLHPMEPGSEHRLHVSKDGDVLLAVVLHADITLLETP